MLEIPITLIIFIVVFFFLGMMIDKNLGFEIPVFTIIFSIIGLFGGLWSIFKKHMS